MKKLCIGIIIPNHTMPLSYNNNDGLIGFEHYNESLAFHTDGNYATFYCNSRSLACNPGKIDCSWREMGHYHNKDHSNENTIQTNDKLKDETTKKYSKFDTYFLFEIDLISSVIRVVGTAFDLNTNNNSKKPDGCHVFSCTIPEKLLRKVNENMSQKMQNDLLY